MSAISNIADYEASQKASRRLMYQMRKGFTAEQFDALAEIVDAQERFRLQLADDVATYPVGVIVNLKTRKAMKREDARPEPQPDPPRIRSAAEVARADCKAGKIRKDYENKLHAAIRAGTDADHDAANAWLEEYWDTVRVLGYGHYIQMTERGQMPRLAKLRRAA